MPEYRRGHITILHAAGFGNATRGPGADRHQGPEGHHTIYRPNFAGSLCPPPPMRPGNGDRNCVTVDHLPIRGLRFPRTYQARRAILMAVAPSTFLCTCDGTATTGYCVLPGSEGAGTCLLRGGPLRPPGPATSSGTLRLLHGPEHSAAEPPACAPVRSLPRPSDPGYSRNHSHTKNECLSSPRQFFSRSRGRTFLARPARHRMAHRRGPSSRALSAPVPDSEAVVDAWTGHANTAPISPVRRNAGCPRAAADEGRRPGRGPPARRLGGILALGVRGDTWVRDVLW